MAKSTKVVELAATLGLDGQQLIDQINGMGLGFSVRTHTNTLSDEQVKIVQQAIASQRQARGGSAIDARSQSTSKGTVRIRRRRDDEGVGPDVAETGAATGPAKTLASKAEAARAAANSHAAASSDEGPAASTKAQASTAAELSQETQDSLALAQSESVTKNKDAALSHKKDKKDDSAGHEDSKLESEKKSRKKNEHVLEIAPKFEKEPAIKIEASFTDDDDASQLETDDELNVDASDADVDAVVAKPKAKSKKPAPAEVVTSVVPTETEADAAKKKVVRPSNITGAIDPALIRAMLVRDNKKFSTTPPSSTGNDKVVRQSPGPRTVVNQQQIYGAPTQRNSHTNNTGNIGFKKGKKGQKAPVFEKPQVNHPQMAEHKRVIRLAGNISIADIAKEMGVKAAEVIRFLMKDLGLMMTVNQTVDLETAELITAEHGYTIEDVSFKEEAFTESRADRPEDLILRAPVVTVMGHVDHGKTSLLDAIRNSRVTASEAGGITQHIGASTIDTANGKVVFLDTPGHEAFTALRARGAKVTDLVVLVVAADDGVMPQTVEAINHAKAANVPIIVAVNKIDKASANPERVRQALTEYQLIAEEWGGSTLFKNVSALTGEGVQELLELIQLQSEVLELKANPDKEARGILLEAYKDNRRGIVASLIVQEGTLRVNDILVSGACSGKVKTMINDKGKSIQVAGPSTPVEITGLSDIPDAGEPFFVTQDEKIAKSFTTQIKERKRNADLTSRKFDPWSQFNDNKQLNIIIKADVQGSLEALIKSLGALSTSDVELVVVHSAVGGTTESDVQLAVASNAMIIGFNTRPEARAAEIAKREGIVIESFSIIYDTIDYIRDAMSGLLDPIIGENVIGHAEIRNTFNVPKIGTIAGGYVTNGIIRRNAKCRLLRSGKVIYESRIASLKRFKDDAKEVRNGFECGFSIENYNDLKVGDVVEVYEITETKQTL
ncbi:MAG: translation initiation factor IF-2 [Proteobacteria bacterium]|nr:translation initiation factor IF-2 [Pseudomonadota bacterium]